MCLQQGDGCVGYLAVGVALASGYRDSAMGTSQLHVELFPKQRDTAMLPLARARGEKV